MEWRNVDQGRKGIFFSASNISQFTDLSQTGKKDLLFNATRAKHTPPLSRPIEEQEDRESQKLWYTTAQAVIARNHDVATDEKTKIEDTQREEAARRAADGVEWVPRIFRAVRSGPGGSEQGEEDLDWILNANMYDIPCLSVYGKVLI